MTLYSVQKCAYVWYSVEVEADSAEEAEEIGNELLNIGKHTDEEFADWDGMGCHVDEVEELFTYEPTPSPTKEEPDLIY